MNRQAEPDELYEAIRAWMQENMGQYTNARDAKSLARAIRTTREYRMAMQAQKDLDHIFDLSDVIRREREVTI